MHVFSLSKSLFSSGYSSVWGGFLALFSGLLFTVNNFIIKFYSLDATKMLLVRCTIQVGGVTKHVLYSKCRRKYYNGNAAENTNLYIFCGTGPQWYFHYNIFFGTCFRVYFLRHLVIRYFLWHYLYFI